MVSLRSIAQCVDASGTISIVHDFLGYRHGLPESTSTSLLKQIRLLQGKHIHLDLILVALEQISKPLERDVDYAVYSARETYAQVDLGIGRVKFFQIPEAEANGYAEITRRTEAKRLTKKWSGPNHDAIDVFFVPNYAVGKDKVGIAPIGILSASNPDAYTGLPCNKDLYLFSGCVIGLRWFGIPTGHSTLGQVLAHEVGHGLGLPHVTNIGNLMYNTATGTDLVESQGATMRHHCMVQDGC
jgi:hypothetical protein